MPGRAPVTEKTSTQKKRATRPRSPAQQARDRLALAARQGTPDEIVIARRELAEANLEQHIREVVDAAPPLTAAQRERLALLLNPGAKT